MLGVSRTPLREALRMLQEEGLIEADHQQRTRIPSLDPQKLDALYATRIVLEALGIKLTVPHLKQADLQNLEALLKDMDVAAVSEDLDAWETSHRQFHRLLMSGAGEQLRAIIASYADRCEYYRLLHTRHVYAQNPAQVLSEVAAGHRSVLEACQAREGGLAAYRLVQHLARTALSLITQLTPEYDPAAVRMALLQVKGDPTFLEEKKRGRRRKMGEREPSCVE